MRWKVRWVADAAEVLRPVLICLLGMAVAAAGMGVFHGRWPVVVLALLIAVLGVALVLQVRSSMVSLDARHQRARDAAAEAERHYVEVLRRIVSYTEGRDRFRRGHSENVGRLAERIAREMGLPERTCAQLSLAGQLHDIGLLAVPENLLSGEARFGVREFRSLQVHSHVSHEVLKPLTILREVLPAVRSHHERMNGTGYPDGKNGEQIPLSGRILAVADAYDALTHDRPHRAALSPLPALREMRRCCPSGYDPACVEALAAVLNIPALETTPAAQPARCAQPAQCA